MTPNMRLFIVLIAMMLGIHYCLTITSGKIAETFENGGSGSTTHQQGDRAPTCPDVLIQKDGKIVLFASKLQKVPGVNPLVFDNLEEYVEFTEWQRSKGITCPVLYLQSTHNAQGGTEYRARPDIIDPQGGLNQTTNNGTTTDVITQYQSGTAPDLTQLNGVNDAPYFSQGGGEGSITGARALNTGPETMGYVSGGTPDGNKGSLPGFTQSAFYQGTITPMDEQLRKQKELEKSPSAMDTTWGGKDYTNSLIDAGAYEGRTRKKQIHDDV